MAQLTAKEEKFCQLLVEYGDASKAYREAYNSKGNVSTVNRRAWEQQQKSHIAARIKALREELRIANRQKLDDILEELDEAKLVAQLTGNASATVAAITAKAKLLGFENNKLDLTNSDGSLKPITRIERRVVSNKKDDRKR